MIAQTQEKYTINICRVSTNSALPVEWSLLLKHPEIFSNLTPQWRFTAKIAETALCLWIYNYKNPYVHTNNEIILKMSSDFETFIDLDFTQSVCQTAGMLMLMLLLFSPGYCDKVSRQTVYNLAKEVLWSASSMNFNMLPEIYLSSAHRQHSEALDYIRGRAQLPKTVKYGAAFLMQKASGKKQAVDNKKMQTNSETASYREEVMKAAWKKGSWPHLMRNGKSVTRKQKKKCFWKDCWIWTAEKSKTFYCFCSDKNTPEGLSSHNLLKVEPLCNRKHFNWNHHKLVCDALAQHPKGFAVGD